jgi:hypothetical protein
MSLVRVSSSSRIGEKLGSKSGGIDSASGFKLVGGLAQNKAF